MLPLTSLTRPFFQQSMCDEEEDNQQSTIVPQEKTNDMDSTQINEQDQLSEQKSNTNHAIIDATTNTEIHDQKSNVVEDGKSIETMDSELSLNSSCVDNPNESHDLERVKCESQCDSKSELSQKDSEHVKDVSEHVKDDSEHVKDDSEHVKDDSEHVKDDSEQLKDAKSIELDCGMDDEDGEEGSGFPKCFNGWVIRGKTIPINKKTWNDIEIDKTDTILDCVSQVVPILLKKANIFPSRFENDSTDKKSKDDANETNDLTDEKIETKESTKDNNEMNEKSICSDTDEKKDSTTNDQEPADETVSNMTTVEEQKKEEKSNPDTFLMISDYFDSSVGNFLMGIGLSKCKEALHKDGMRQVQRAIRKEGERAEHVEELKKQTQLYNEYKGANSIFTYDQFRCTICDFKSESKVVMAGHYLTPHMVNKRDFKCNFCNFTTRDSRVIQYHFNAAHKKYCNSQPTLHLYECPTCEYESNQKSKAANHMAKCVKTFEESERDRANVQTTHVSENEYPAITPRPISQSDLNLYNSTMQALKPLALQPIALNSNTSLPFIPGLPKALQKQMLILLQQQIAQQNAKLGKVIQNKLTNQHQNALRQLRQQQQQNSLMSNLLNNSLNSNALASLQMNGSNLLSNLTSLSNLSNLGGLNNNLNNLNNLNSFAKASPHLYHFLKSGSQLATDNLTSNSNASMKNRSPVNQLHQQHQLLQQQKHQLQQSQQQLKMDTKGQLSNNVKPSTSKVQLATATGTNKAGTFVICEICDGYIEDLEQLRTHMSVMHKVKIHPKMIASRPPLNCQKCQWRFFTDQGLERHLLGAHGLVTSNMQDLVDQEQDGGRCTICAKLFTSKLVLHMNQSHQVTLRPAHLSYKCTVCSETFGLYRLFENHVYMIHSNTKRGTTDNQSAKRTKTANGI